ncbi:Poly [ADP-ribose] polymerase [Echinococcus granulosus]|uniref:Poly [ADP-ribose] polymerase n=1 Tax=Echinococcus granulosus TaxID=6210 RepID=W6U0X3_ECHGR|nr:Poly [ADP-ribose] polymerase [Echinococcus granulosus]EUB54765.1 Poly [ADP-ribose] polymerase [Echinococcus granulosus]
MVSRAGSEVHRCVLFQVSLGEINPLMHPDRNANRLPKGKHSALGVGRNMPDPSTWITLDDGVVVPCGKIIKSKVANALVWYNEFIVCVKYACAIWSN